MSAVISEHDVTVHQGDVREQLALLPSGSVQCIVTSPPYYGLRDYGVDGQIGLEPSPAEYVAEMVGVFREARRVLADDGVLWLNLGDTYASKTKGTGGSGASSTLGVSHDGTLRMTPAGILRSVARQQHTPTRIDPGLPEKNLMGIPWRVAFGLQDDDWILRNAVIWNKPNAMPESVTDRLSCRYEHVFLFSKSRRYTFDLDPIREDRSRGERFDAVRSVDAEVKGHLSAGSDSADRMRGGTNPASVWQTGVYKSEGRNPGDVWTIATAPFAGAHFATMPPELVRRCVLAGCPADGTVLDPFAGSGTTLMVARQLGRKSVGVELNPAYVEIIRGRIGDTPFDFGASA